jgi:hypothetical protein
MFFTFNVIFPVKKPNFFKMANQALRKLLLINPANQALKGFNIDPSTRFMPLWLGIVAALTPPHWEVELLDEGWEKFTFKPADLVDFTSYTASAFRAYETAAISVQRPRCVVKHTGNMRLINFWMSLFNKEAMRRKMFRTLWNTKSFKTAYFAYAANHSYGRMFLEDVFHTHPDGTLLL